MDFRAWHVLLVLSSVAVCCAGLVQPRAPAHRGAREGREGTGWGQRLLSPPHHHHPPSPHVGTSALTRSALPTPLPPALPTPLPPALPTPSSPALPTPPPPARGHTDLASGVLPVAASKRQKTRGVSQNTALFPRLVRPGHCTQLPHRHPAERADTRSDKQDAPQPHDAPVPYVLCNASRTTPWTSFFRLKLPSFSRKVYLLVLFPLFPALQSASGKRSRASRKGTRKGTQSPASPSSVTWRGLCLWDSRRRSKVLGFLSRVLKFGCMFTSDSSLSTYTLCHLSLAIALAVLCSVSTVRLWSDVLLGRSWFNSWKKRLNKEEKTKASRTHGWPLVLLSLLLVVVCSGSSRAWPDVLCASEVLARLWQGVMDSWSLFFLAVLCLLQHLGVRAFFRLRKAFILARRRRVMLSSSASLYLCWLEGELLGPQVTLVSVSVRVGPSLSCSLSLTLSMSLLPIIAVSFTQ